MYLLKYRYILIAELSGVTREQFYSSLGWVLNTNRKSTLNNNLLNYETDLR